MLTFQIIVWILGLLILPYLFARLFGNWIKSLADLYYQSNPTIVNYIIKDVYYTSIYIGVIVIIGWIEFGLYLIFHWYILKLSMIFTSIILILFWIVNYNYIKKKMGIF
jgi:hypothetical protein